MKKKAASLAGTAARPAVGAVTDPTGLFSSGGVAHARVMSVSGCIKLNNPGNGGSRSLGTQGPGLKISQEGEDPYDRKTGL